MCFCWQACKTGKGVIEPGIKPLGRRVKPLKPVDLLQNKEALFFFHKLYRLYRFYMPAMRFYIRFHTVLPVLHACHIKSLPSLFKFFQTSKSPQVPSSPFHVQSRFPPSPFQVASTPSSFQVPSSPAKRTETEYPKTNTHVQNRTSLLYVLPQYLLFSVTPPSPQSRVDASGRRRLS